MNITSVDDFNIILAIVILFAYILIDGMYAFYTQSVIKGKAFVSATTSSVMHFLIAFGVLNYVRNFWYIIPLAIGSWIGTYIVVKMESKSNPLHTSNSIPPIE